MWAIVRYGILRTLIVLAALAQVFIAGFVSAAAPADLARIICMPSGAPPSPADAALADLLRELNLNGGGDQGEVSVNCSLCVLAHVVPPCAPIVLQTPALLPATDDLVPTHIAVVKRAKRGPPVGGRAPPFSQ